jgi:hypothetical protein
MEQLPGTGNSQIELDFDNKDDREEVKCEHEDWVFATFNRYYEIEELTTDTIICKIRCMICLEEGFLTAELKKEHELEWD